MPREIKESIEQPFDSDPKQRFSSRVADYVKYRPGYPDAIVDFLKTDCGFKKSSVVADVGSGTGILTELFLKNGNSVFGVEPNPDMRAAADKTLSRYQRFTSIEGSAEATTLTPRCVDFVTAAQAFHWFKRKQAKREFARILKPSGWVVLIWNDRLIDTTSFLRLYEALLQRYALDYQQVDHKNLDESVFAEFFGGGDFLTRAFENSQTLDFQSLKGRLLSSSYAPAFGHPNHASMIASLRSIFSEHEDGGSVAIQYETKVYFGRIADVEQRNI